jgi:hypothetical protein
MRTHAQTQMIHTINQLTYTYRMCTLSERTLWRKKQKASHNYKCTHSAACIHTVHHTYTQCQKARLKTRTQCARGVTACSTTARLIRRLPHRRRSSTRCPPKLSGRCMRTLHVRICRCASVSCINHAWLGVVLCHASFTRGWEWCNTRFPGRCMRT